MHEAHALKVLLPWLRPRRFKPKSTSWNKHLMKENLCTLFLHFIPIQHTHTHTTQFQLTWKKSLKKCVEPIDWMTSSDLKSNSKSLLAIMKFRKMQTEIKMNLNRLYLVRISFEKDLKKKQKETWLDEAHASKVHIDVDITIWLNQRYSHIKWI